MFEQTEEQWQAATQQYTQANFLVSWAYGQAMDQAGHLNIRQAGDGWLIQGTVRDARRGRYFEVGANPLLDWSDSAKALEVVECLKQVASDQDCAFVRVRPQIEDTEPNRSLFNQLGFKLAPMHLNAEHTSIIDLRDQSVEELLANMRKKTRYEVRAADKKELTVIEDHSEAALESFYELQKQTADRQGFVLEPRGELMAEMKELSSRSQAKLYHAYHQHQLLASAFVVFYGTEADYRFGASTPEGRNFPGAYALQWQAIQDAHAAGMERYNLWGTAPEDQPEHRFAGVTTFKQGFGGQTVRYLPAHDLVINKLAYGKNWVIETARKKKRGL